MSTKNEVVETHDAGWWQKVFEVAATSPGVRVDRARFLQKELQRKVPQSVIDDAIKNGTIAAGISRKMASKLAQNAINSKCALTTTISFTTGLPGGIAGLFGGCAIDILQYYGNFFRLAQQLMYIYGYKDISELDNSQSEVMIALLGAASGIEVAQIFVTKELPKIAEKVTARVISKETSKTLIKKISDKVLIAIGKKSVPILTGEEMAKLIGKGVPIIGGIVCGTINLVSFKPLAKRLDKCLIEHYDYTENYKKEKLL